MLTILAECTLGKKNQNFDFAFNLSIFKRNVHTFRITECQTVYTVLLIWTTCTDAILLQLFSCEPIHHPKNADK